MRALVALAVLLMPVAAAAAPSARGPALTCPSDVIQARRSKSVAPQTLDKLPPGQLYLTVLRDKGSGCYEPVKVRDGYGGPVFAPQPSKKRR